MTDTPDIVERLDDTKFHAGESWLDYEARRAETGRLAKAELLRLRAEVERLKDDAHYANGTADLAMKHRDEAEARADALQAQLEKVREAAEPFLLTVELDISTSEADEDRYRPADWRVLRVGNFRKLHASLTDEGAKG